MSRTERLYYDDSALLEFEATVVGHGTWKGTPTLILDCTAFHPEGGGQLGDQGTVAGLAVIDAQEVDDGRVQHVLRDPNAALPPDGARVRGAVAGERRRGQMAMHTGQHLLSAALFDAVGANTLGVRLTETVSSIELDRDNVAESALARAEALVNELIDADLPVRTFFPSAAELATLKLRRASKVSENIRIIQVGDFDATPCGGTHCQRSAQIGVFHIVAAERAKGKTRVTFSAGRAARTALIDAAGELAALGRRLSCRVADLPGVVDKLKRDCGDAREALARAQARLGELIADHLAAAARASGTTRVVAVLDDATSEVLRQVAARLTALPEVVALLGGRSPDGLSVLVARGPAASLHCGDFVKRAAAAAGGRGGGRAESAEGRLPATVDWERLVASLLADAPV